MFLKIEDYLPTILCNTRLWSAMLAPERIIDSLIRTPGPITAPAPMLTLGPNLKVGSRNLS